jgi:hypothetical protein
MHQYINLNKIIIKLYNILFFKKKIKIKKSKQYRYYETLRITKQ